MSKSWKGKRGSSGILNILVGMKAKTKLKTSCVSMKPRLTPRKEIVSKEHLRKYAKTEKYGGHLKSIKVQKTYF